MASTVPWPTGSGGQPQAQQPQRRAFADARARAENASSAANSDISSSSTNKSSAGSSSSGPTKSFGSKRSDGSSVVAKFGAMYGGTTSSNKENGNMADKENGSGNNAAEQKDTVAKQPVTSRVAGSSAPPVMSPKFSSLRDAFQKRNQETTGGSGDGANAANAGPPSLSDGFNKQQQQQQQPSNNASRRAARDLRSKSSSSKSRGSIEVYDENIPSEKTASKSGSTNVEDPITSPQVTVSRSKLKDMKKSNVRLKSEAWEKGVRLQQTQSALYDLQKENEELKTFRKVEQGSNSDDKAVQSEPAANAPTTASVGTSPMPPVKLRSLGVGTVNNANTASTNTPPLNGKPNNVSRSSSVASDSNSEVESVRLRLQNKELKSEISSLRTTVAMADMAVSDNAESNSREVQRLRAELQSTRAELDAVKGAAGQGEMYGKLRKNLEAQADTLQSQLDAEKRKSRGLERTVDELKVTKSGASKDTSNRGKEMKLRKDLSVAMSDIASKEKQIKTLQAELKAATSVVPRDANGADPVRQRDAEIESLRRTFNEFKSLHADCDVKGSMLAEQEEKLKSSEKEIRAANDRATELQQLLEQSRNNLMLLQNESTRHMEKSIKAKEQSAMKQWTAYKKQEAVLREEIAGRDEELDETRRDVALLESKLEEAEHLITATVERVDALKAELGDKNAQLEEAAQAVEMLDAKLSIADTNAVVSEKMIGDLEHQLTVLEGQKMEILNGLEGSAAQIDELNKVVATKDSEIAAAKQQLEKEVTEGKSQNKVLYGSLQQSADRVSELQQATKEKDSEIATLKERVAESDNNYETLQRFMKRGTEQIEDLENELQKKDGVEKDYKILQAKYEEAVNSLEKSSKEAVENSAKMRGLLETKEKELQDMRKELDASKLIAEDAHEYQSLVEELEEKVALQEKMIAERETRIGNLEETVDEQEEQMQQHCDRITASAREMQTVLEDAGTRQSTLEKALTELDAELEESNKRNEEHEATITKMEGLFAEYEEKLMAANNAVESQKDAYENQLELLNKVNSDMESIHQSLRGEVAEREGELHASQFKVTELEEELKQNQATVVDLNSKLDIAAQKLSADSEETSDFKMKIDQMEVIIAKTESERDALLSDIARVSEEKATAATDYKCLEDTVEMYKMTLENAQSVSQEKIKSLEEQLLDAERTHADAEEELHKVLASKKELEDETEQMLSASKSEIDQLKAEIVSKDKEVLDARALVASMEPVQVVARDNVDASIASIDADVAMKNADLANKVQQKDEELENMKVCLEYLKERITKANNKNDNLKKEIRQMMQRNSVLENELRTMMSIGNPDPPAFAMTSPDSVAIKQERQQIESDALLKYVAQRQEKKEEVIHASVFEEDADPRC
mmetsp:Transcript_37307/g.81763  ORF Transcript_37307/g.81763 Transcript_37307/m.81763 type:complete len:1382 (-) Transcript_37307:2269-6414(-)